MLHLLSYCSSYNEKGGFDWMLLELRKHPRPFAAKQRKSGRQRLVRDLG